MNDDAECPPAPRRFGAVVCSPLNGLRDGDEVSSDPSALPCLLIHLEFDGAAIKVSLIERDNHVSVLGWVALSTNVGAQAPVSRVPVCHKGSIVTGKTGMAIQCIQYANLLHDDLRVTVRGDDGDPIARKIVEACRHFGANYVSLANVQTHTQEGR